MLSKLKFSQSEFNNFQVYLIYLTSYSGLLSIGFFATFQYLAARNKLSIRILKYLLIYLLVLLSIYFFIYYYNLIDLEDWSIGLIVILYLYNESLLNVYTGQRLYKLYYLYSSLRYLLLLFIVLTGILSGKYYILLLFELILFFVLSFKFYKKYSKINESENINSIFISNIFPNLTSSIGAKNFLFYTILFLTEADTAQIKFTYAFFGLINFIPQIYLTDYINKIINSQNFNLHNNKLKYILIFQFIISLVFSFLLFFLSGSFNLFEKLDLIIIILVSILNFLIQTSIFFNQFLFAQAKQKIRLYGDLLFSILMFSILNIFFKIDIYIFLITSSISVFLCLLFNFYSYKSTLIK
jgi:hypothetical protein